MRRGWVLGAVLVVLGLGAWLAFRNTPGALPPAASASTRASNTRPRTASRTLSQATPPASRDVRSHIRGTVRGAKGPVPGAVVLASAPVEGESLSELTCVVPGTSHPLLECTSGPEREQLLSLVARRQGETPILARAVTEKNGTFTLEGLSAGAYSLWVESPEGTGLRHDVAAGAEGVELLLGAGVRLSGTVTDDAKRPIAGALVTAIFKAQSRFFEAVSDERGHFRLGPLPPGQYALLISKEGLETWSGGFTGYEPEVEETFIIPTRKRISGVVRRAGTPVAGAEVFVRADPLAPSTRTTTDVMGRFSLEGLRADGQVLVATQGDEGATEMVYLEEGQREFTDVTLELAPAAYVRGRVLDEDRKPVQGAWVSAEWRNGELTSWTSTYTDEEGRYRLGPGQPGPVNMRVDLKGHVLIRHPEEVPRGEHTVDFTLARVALVEGVLVDATGKPVSAEGLSLRPLEAQGEPPSEVHASSDAEGRFSLGAPRPGHYRLEVGGRRVKKRVLEVSAPSSQRLVGESLPLVMVEVVDEGGMPLPNVSLGLWPAHIVEDWEPSVSGGATDLRGRSVVAVPEPGRYQLIAELARGDFVRTASQWVELGETPARVRLRFEGGQGLSGMAVDSRGQPLAGVHIQVASARTVQEDPVCGGERRGVSTGPDGRFAFRQLTGEKFVLTVSKQGYELAPSYGEFQRVEVKPGMKDVRVMLVQKTP